MQDIFIFHQNASQNADVSRNCSTQLKPCFNPPNTFTSLAKQSKMQSSLRLRKWNCAKLIQGE